MEGILFLIIIVLPPIVAFIDILRSDFKNGGEKLVWLIVVIALGPIGALLYFIIGRKKKLPKE